MRRQHPEVHPVWCEKAAFATVIPHLYILGTQDGDLAQLVELRTGTSPTQVCGSGPDVLARASKMSVMTMGVGIAQLVKMPDSWSKGCEFESRHERRESFLIQGYLSVLTFIRCPFHLHVTAVARKSPRSFFQECRWQVTPEHVYTPDPTKSEWADYANQA